MFKASFLHPTESLFVPAVAVSFGTILINIVEYGFGQVGQWLNEAVLVVSHSQVCPVGLKTTPPHLLKQGLDLSRRLVFLVLVFNTNGASVVLVRLRACSGTEYSDILLIMEYTALHYRTNDTNLDLPRLSAADCKSLYVSIRYDLRMNVYTLHHLDTFFLSIV